MEFPGFEVQKISANSVEISVTFEKCNKHFLAVLI